MNATHVTYCQDLVSRFDYDRYVLAMSARPGVRDDLFALFAFNFELARTREVIRDVHAGYLRLAWWSETLEQIAGAQAPLPNHDIAKALAVMVQKYSVPVPILESLIEARRFDLEAVAPSSLEGMACYAGATNTPLLKTTALVCGHEADDATLNHLGTAYGLCGLVRALPFMASQKRCYLPADTICDLGLAPEQIDHIGPSAKLSSHIRTVLAFAQTHLDKARTVSGILKKQKALTQFYIDRIASAGYDPFDDRVQRGVPFLGFRLFFR